MSPLFLTVSLVSRKEVILDGFGGPLGSPHEVLNSPEVERPLPLSGL